MSNPVNSHGHRRELTVVTLPNMGARTLRQVNHNTFCSLHLNSILRALTELGSILLPLTSSRHGVIVPKIPEAHHGLGAHKTTAGVFLGIHLSG